jgi:hypothetical protein
MKPLVRLPLIYGAIAGALALFVMILLYYINRHPFLIPVYIDSRIFLFGIFLFFCLRELRDIHFEGILYFWQGLIASFLFLCIFSVVAALGLSLFMAVVPDFVQSYISLTISQIKALPADVIDRIGKEVVARNLLALPATNAFELVKLYTWQSYMIGLFLTIIISVIVRRTPKFEKSNP